MNKKIILSIILALLPIISFSFSYYYSVQSNTLHEFKTNYAPYYLDFFFIIFNAMIFFAININKKVLIYSMLFSTIVLSALNFMYWTFSPGISAVHLIFAIIEMSLLITAIFSRTTNRQLYLIMMIPIIIYFASAFIIEIFVYTPVVILESLPHLVGLIVIGLRIIRPAAFVK